MKNTQQTAAGEFAAKWKGRGYEKGDSQTFWLELLQKVLGVSDPYAVISFENQVKLSNTSFIDAYIESTHTLIEQKSIDKDLRKPIPQSDGSLLTPFQQAKRYVTELPRSKHPRWVVVCNFRQFYVYDMENPQGEPEIVELENLGKEYWRLNFLVDTGSEHLQKEMEVSLKAGELATSVSHINGYLLDADDVFVESRQKPLCDVPEIGIGNKPIDDGNYLFTEDEMIEFIKSEPASERWFKPFYGSQEFINRKPRYCLWLGECPPNILRSMPHCIKRVEAVREFRLSSKSEGTRKLAERPTRFHVENMPDTSYIVIPKVSSEKRKYIPIGLFTPDILCSDLVFLLPHSSLYHFGILTSNVHNGWMRVVAGRLKSDYRYSKDIVYNNFPWPSPNDTQKIRIEQTAQGILDARAKYPECSLADLYDEVTMPAELRKAHQENDKAVMDAYGFDWRKMTESECVAELLKMYQKLTSEEK